ncbi:MAG: cytochrome c3 family protein [Candidatus Sulfotelmatobacter sp.]
MKTRLSLACALLVAQILVVQILATQILVTQSFAQTTPPPTADVLGMHNLSLASGASVYSQGGLGCTNCHAPHSGIGGITPLWNQRLSQSSYVPYASSTDNTQGTQPTLGKTSSLCLSCHDGTVGVGQSAAYGPLPVVGSMNAADSFGTTLTGSHPFSLVVPIKDASNLVASLASQGKTADPTGAVKLVNGNIECTSCHSPHIQAIDRVAQNFLIRDSSNAQMCLACHDPNRVLQGQINPLAGFINSVHQTATNQVSPDAHVGSYPTVGVNACTSCHMSHNSVAPARLLRPATPAAPSYDPVTQNCMTCHAGGTYLSPATVPNIMSEVTKVSHPLPAGNNFHDAAEAPLLNHNRHATCVDCHSAHASNAEVTFSAPPAIRPPQQGATGISALDGMTPVIPAVNQYETCLRCHGTSLGKQRLPIFGYPPIRVVAAPDPLNVMQEFAQTATSSHPVTHAIVPVLPQPSLLVSMLNEAGSPSARLVGSQIFCTDCHNSDDNREFGGVGPNGPHGSKWTHLLERRYEFSQAPAPGQLVTNLYPNPDTSVVGPYALCGKCHNLTQILANTSFTQHSLHVSQYGFSCSVCHTAHGMGATSPTFTGERLVNFDGNVVGQNGATPIAYNRNTNTCTLMCHNAAHNANGTVTESGQQTRKVRIK